MQKAGVEPARIAQRLGCELEDVQSAVHGFEAARAALSSDIVDMAVNAEVMIAMGGVGNRLQAAMASTRFTGAYDAEGAPIYEPDHSTALDAIKTTRELAEVSKPKGSGSAINIGINNQQGSSGGTGNVRTFEQRVREKRGVLADGDVKFLGDGKGQEIVDGEMVDDGELDDMADGTSELEIEEADDGEARD